MMIKQTFGFLEKYWKLGRRALLEKKQILHSLSFGPSDIWLLVARKCHHHPDYCVGRIATSYTAAG
jgi:hypothetical protein